MNILEKLLQKRNIKSIDDLEPEEKETFQNWKRILIKEDLSMDDLREFCKNQISIIEGKWKDLNIEQVKKAELIPYHVVYKTLEQVLNAPRSERENLEAQLNQLLNNE